MQAHLLRRNWLARSLSRGGQTCLLKFDLLTMPGLDEPGNRIQTQRSFRQITHRNR